MFNKFRHVLKNHKGFTLVELMVVVVIIGILVAIAVPVYNKTTDNAKEKACFANQRIIEGSAQQFVANGGTLTDQTSGVGIQGLLKDYILAVPVCPSAGTYSLTATTGLVACTGHKHY